MSTSVEQRWVQRWDAQQEYYIADREERFQVVADVVAWSLGSVDGAVGAAGAVGAVGAGRPPRIADLGCGPGSLSTRLAARFPGAEIVGIDADPLLLGLGAAVSAPGVRAVEGNLTDPAWPDALGLAGPWDAAVSSTALHWLRPEDLRAVYRTVFARLRPGGVFVDADHRRPADARAAALLRHLRVARAERAGVTGNEDWRAWWEGVLADPALAELVDTRSAATIAHDGGSMLSLEEQQAALREAGFGSVGTVWQSGDDYVVVAVR